MGEYSEAVLEVFSANRAFRNYFGISSVSPCAMETYHNWIAFKTYHATGEAEDIPKDRLLVMDDGHYQEVGIVNILRRAGYSLTYTLKEQVTVTVGEAKVPGHPDGFIKKPDGTINRRLAEFKARNYSSFMSFKEGGLDNFPHIRTQVQLYLASPDLPYDDIDEAMVYFKHKETSATADVIEVKDEEYSGPIIEFLDDMFIRGNIPVPVRIPMCKGCKFSEKCWNSELLDFTGFDSKPELGWIGDKWIQGKSYEALGEKLIEEAEDEIRKHVGKTEEVFMGPIKVKQSSYPSRRFNKELYLKDHTEEEYDRYCKESITNKMTIRLL